MQKGAVLVELQPLIDGKMRNLFDQIIQLLKQMDELRAAEGTMPRAEFRKQFARLQMQIRDARDWYKKVRKTVRAFGYSARSERKIMKAYRRQVAAN